MRLIWTNEIANPKLIPLSAALALCLSHMDLYQHEGYGAVVGGGVIWVT